MNTYHYNLETQVVISHFPGAKQELSLGRLCGVSTHDGKLKKPICPLVRIFEIVHWLTLELESILQAVEEKFNVAGDGYREILRGHKWIMNTGILRTDDGVSILSHNFGGCVVMT